MDKKVQQEEVGLVYVAFGYEYLLMAAYSAYTAKQHNPDIVCTVVTNIGISDRGVLSPYFDDVKEVDMKHEKNRDIKTRAIEFVSYSKGAYVDCDTEFGGDINAIIECLNHFDIALKMDPRPTNKNYYISDGIHGNEFPYWNSGVIFFRAGENARRFFSEWRKNFYSYGKRSDQPALARTVYENPDIRCLTLNCMWNTFVEDFALLKKKGQCTKSRIWHYRDVKDFPELARKIISHHGIVGSAVRSDDASISNEMVRVCRRYNTIDSWYYRNRFIRKYLLRAMNKLHRMGYMEDLDLTRRRYREGEQFAEFNEG